MMKNEYNLYFELLLLKKIIYSKFKRLRYINIIM